MIRFQLDALQMIILLSVDPDAKYYPSPENVKLYTPKECSERVSICYPQDTLHNKILQSFDPDAKYSPFTEKATQCTLSK